MKKTVLCIGLFLAVGVTVFAQDITTAHYRFEERYDMGRGSSVSNFGGRAITTSWARVWTLYNIDKQPAIDIQTFYNALFQEQNSSGRYENGRDSNLRHYWLSFESDDDIMLTIFMDSHGQNVALMSVIDVPIEEFTMIYKLDGVWAMARFTRYIDMSR